MRANLFEEFIGAFGIGIALGIATGLVILFFFGLWHWASWLTGTN